MTILSNGNRCHPNVMMNGVKVHSHWKYGILLSYEIKWGLHGFADLNDASMKNAN